MADPVATSHLVSPDGAPVAAMDDASTTQAYLAGQIGVAGDHAVVKDKSGVVGTVPVEQLKDALSSGYVLTDPAALAVAQAKARKEELYGGVLGGIAAAAHGAQVGINPLSDAYMRNPWLGAALGNPSGLILGPERTEALRKGIVDVKEAHPYLHGAGEVGGMIGSTIATAGVGGAAKLATPMGLVEGAGRAASGFASGAVGTGLAGRLATRAAGGAAEGAVLGAGQYVADATLEDHEYRAEELLASMGLGALVGGGLGGGLGVASEGLSAAGRAALSVGARAESAGGDLATALMRRGKEAAGRIENEVQGVVSAHKEYLEAKALSMGEKGLGGLTREQRALDRLPDSPEFHAIENRILFEDMPKAVGKPGEALSHADQHEAIKKLQRTTGARLGNTEEELGKLGGKVDVSEIADQVSGTVEKDFARATNSTERKAMERELRELEESYGAKYEVDKETGEQIRVKRGFGTFEDVRRERIAIQARENYAKVQQLTASEKSYRTYRNVMEDEWMRQGDELLSKRIEGLSKEIDLSSSVKGKAALQKEISKYEGLLDNYRAAKKDYRVLSAYEGAAKRGSERDSVNRIGGLGEHLSGMAGGAAGHAAGDIPASMLSHIPVVGGALAAGTRLVGGLVGAGVGSGGEWVAKHYGQQLGANVVHKLATGQTIREVSVGIQGQIKNGVHHFLEQPVGRTAKGYLEAGGSKVKGLLTEGAAKAMASASRLGAAVKLGAEGVGVAGKRSTIKQFEARRDDIRAQQAQPSLVATRILGTGLAHSHPEIARSLAQKTQAANDFLASKLPLQAIRPGVSGPRMSPPSTAELQKFDRYARAVDKPLTVLDDLRDGVLTPQAVEAIKTVYPRMYADIQMQAREAAAGKDKELPFEKRVALGTLLGVPTDPTLTPEFQHAMHQAAVATEMDKKAQQAERGPVKPAPSRQTQTGRIASR